MKTAFITGANVGQAFLQPNPQIQGSFGGNPNLNEETSDTWTVGAVIQPRFIPRLAVTIDYFNISIEDRISVLGGSAANVLNLCYNEIRDASSIYCQAINRNPGGVISGEQFSIEVLNANIASHKTSGVDLQIDYSQPLGFSMFGQGESRLNFFFLGTWTDKSDFAPVADLPGINECAGTFGLICPISPIPDWKWTTRVSWVDGPLTATARWRHLAGLEDDDLGTDYVVEHLNSYDLFDLAFAFDVNDNVTLNLGVNNLFDKEPQLIGSNQEQANTYPGTFDVLGRDFFISANFRF